MLRQSQPMLNIQDVSPYFNGIFQKYNAVKWHISQNKHGFTVIMYQNEVLVSPVINSFCHLFYTVISKLLIDKYIVKYHISKYLFSWVVHLYLSV